MSEKMTPLPVGDLLDWISAEYATSGTVFGVAHPYTAGTKSLPIFGESIETPFGPAAGPNTQLAQNLIASYFTGSRFFELKTVQKLDGDDLAACISRPCIIAEDECYNCEWSTELTVPQALDEYIKAWCILKVLSKEFGLGSPDGFVFNMSVGYDLEGISGEKIDNYLESMKNATNTPVFQECLRELSVRYPHLEDYISKISPHVSRSVTVSTLHGCPPEEIERIASYLITKKGLNTYVKCNPTILGYETARSLLDGMGFDYIAFDDHHFKADLQYKDAIPMFRRLQSLCLENGLEFGLKLSNTFPVQVKKGELPSEEMYMAGKSLFPLTIEMANRVAREFDGKIRLSYSGGADFFNIDKLFSCNIWPITMATTELKPGGYQRFHQIAQKLEALPYHPFTRVDCDKVSALATAILTDPFHVKSIKDLPSRKSEEKVPLLDCFAPPCRGGCPIEQDIPQYIELVAQGRYVDAMSLIVSKNPLPFMTGTICAHHCMDRCTRNFYDLPVDIRSAKLVAAERGFDDYLKTLTPPSPWKGNEKVAVIGGGPSGMSAGFFLGRAGVPVTIFEKESKLGGIVRHVIPEFRITHEALDLDVSLLESYDVDIRCNTVAPSVADLKKEGYTHIYYAVGAWKSGVLDISGTVKPVIPWLKSLKSGEKVTGHVCVVGGGNTAMDAARAALRSGATSSTLVYRRTKRYMPADVEELELAIEDGVQFLELVSPLEQKDGKLICQKMALGDPDSSGRRSVTPTDEKVEIPCDLVISAVGEKVETEIFDRQGLTLTEGIETSDPCVFVGGDSRRGPATIVEGIADATTFANMIIGEREVIIPENADVSRKCALDKKGILCASAKSEGERCLGCQVVCQNCVDVCPNRANTVIAMPDGTHQILHLDPLCNECGNCAAFCPYDAAPYRDKFTLFQSKEEMEESTHNSGFLPLGGKKFLVRLEGTIGEYDLSSESGLPCEFEILILTIMKRYQYLGNL